MYHPVSKSLFISRGCLTSPLNNPRTSNKIAPCTCYNLNSRWGSVVGVTCHVSLLLCAECEKRDNLLCAAGCATRSQNKQVLVPRVVLPGLRTSECWCRGLCYPVPEQTSASAAGCATRSQNKWVSECGSYTVHGYYKYVFSSPHIIFSQYSAQFETFAAWIWNYSCWRFLQNAPRIERNWRGGGRFENVSLPFNFSR